MAAASSEQGSANVVDEIIVTATRQSQAFGRVPVSVAACDHVKMDNPGVRSIGDITRLTPGLSLSPPGASANDVTGTRTTISIRGITSSVGAATTTVTPAGVKVAGLPVGVQIVGPRGADWRTLAVARAFDEQVRGFTAPMA